MKLFRMLVIGVSALVASPLPARQKSPAAAHPPSIFTPQLFAALRAADLRLATIAYRLTTRNVALCRDLQPALGLQLHTLLQYQPRARAAASTAFNFTSAVAIEAVVAGSPGERAGVLPGDSVTAIGGAPVNLSLPAADQPATTADRDAVDQQLAALPPGKSVRLELRRQDRGITVDVAAVPGCRSRFEVHGEDEAAADGAIVQIGAKYLDLFDDDGIAVLVAHELSHIILRHRVRLEAAGAKFGVFSEFGKSLGFHRQSENEADRLSVYLLANAGYDPLLPGRFWRGPGRQLDPGIFRNRAYPGITQRAAILDAEAAKILANARRPVIPGLLSGRDEPLTGTTK